MSPEKLSEEVLEVVTRAQARVGPGSVGAQQYYVDGQPQKFESMNWEDWFRYMEEEALDIINYGVMLTIRINHLKAQVDKVGALHLRCT